MSTYADAAKLRYARAAEGAVLSLYLPVPLDPAELRELPAVAAGLVDGAQRAPGAVAGGGDRDAVLDAIAVQGREWLGHGVALFACQEIGLFEVLELPGSVPGRAVLAPRPHLRPALAALQRCPDYQVVIADRRRAWVLSVAGDQAETVARWSGESDARRPGFGGWHGLKAHRVHQRAIRLDQHHYREIAEILRRVVGAERNPPLVIGGHHDSIAGMLRALPPAARGAFAGAFTVDPRSLTPAAVRDLTRPVIEDYLARRERELAAEALGEAPRRMAAVGLRPSLAAVNEGSAARLLVPREDMVPGFACDRCGALSADGGECALCGAPVGAVPDLLEEMARRTLDGGGEITTLPDASFIAVKLRFPLA